MKALIFSGGFFDGIPEGLDPAQYALTIAADKGYAYAEKSGIVPDVFVGDFDSFCDAMCVKSPEVICLKPEKDMTDTQEALDIAISRGATDITVLGALGGRVDHALANLHLLKYGYDRGACVVLCDKNTTVMLATGDVAVPKKEGFCLSLIPLIKCEHVSVSGVYYPLNDAVMDIGNPYGVSNEFVDDVAHIHIGSGQMLVLICKK